MPDWTRRQFVGSPQGPCVGAARRVDEKAARDKASGLKEVRKSSTRISWSSTTKPQLFLSSSPLPFFLFIHSTFP